MKTFVIAVVCVSLFSCQQLQTPSVELQHESEGERVVEILTSTEGIVRFLPLQDGYFVLEVFVFGDNNGQWGLVEGTGGTEWWHQIEIARGVPFELNLYVIAAHYGQTFTWLPNQGQKALRENDYAEFGFAYSPLGGWGGRTRRHPSSVNITILFNFPVNHSKSDKGQ